MGVLLLGWCLVGCDAVAAEAPGPSSVAPDPPVAAAPAGRIVIGSLPEDVTEERVETWAALPVAQVDAPAIAPDVPQQVLISPDGLMLSWTVMTAMCSETTGTVLVSPEEVEVELDDRNTLEDPDVVCAAGAVSLPVTVVLDEPLEGRPLRVHR